MLPEVREYLIHLDEVRAEVAAILSGLPAEALNWRPQLPADADPTNSPAVLAAHIAGSEHFWIGECIGGMPPTRVRAEEFAYVAQSAEEPLARLAAVGQESRAVLEALSAEQLEGSFTRDGHLRTVRWAILHVIAHTSLHLGHMQLTYQLWAQGKSFKG